MRRNHSAFDYSLILCRKNRYLVVGSPDFGYQLASVRLDLESASPEAIGLAVLSAWERTCRKLDELDRGGVPRPEPARIPLLARRLVSTRVAASILGVSASTIRRLARQGRIPAERTPSGRLRFCLDELSELSRAVAHGSSGRNHNAPPAAHHLKEAI